MSNFTEMREEDLDFDYTNPRLIEFGLESAWSTEEIVQLLWDAMDAKEIAMSIVASGYFQNDPLVVAKENGKNIVVEGNRRLAAVKVLKNREHYKDLISNIPEIGEKELASLDKLPVFKQSREDAWKFLGFKHVNGPAKWGSYAKAKYISEVYKKYKIPLEQIAKQIGDTHKTVQKLYRGLMVIEQAEREEVFDREDVKRKSFSFSHMYTGLQRKGIRNFLNVIDSSEEKENPVPKENIKQLGELCSWLYGSKKDNVEPVVQSQNPDLKKLDEVLQSVEATSVLRSKATLDSALELTHHPSEIFESELITAKRSLVKARGLLSEGYKGASEELLRIAGTIADLADDLYVEMERKKSPGKKQRLTEKD